MAYDEADEDKTKARSQTRTLDYHEAMKADNYKKPVNMSGVSDTSGQIGAGGVDETKTMDERQDDATIGDEEGNVRETIGNFMQGGPSQGRAGERSNE